MKPTQTGIAVALALVVVAVFFIFPGLSPFHGTSVPPTSDATIGTVPTTTPTTTTDQTSSTPMPIQDNGQLQIKDEIVGAGVIAASGDTVTVNYVGALMNGTVFDASANHGSSGFTFKLGANPPQVIQGWDQGIVGMKEGGKRMLVIPAALAYGNQAVGNAIPANSALVFEVQLLKVQKAAAH